MTTETKARPAATTERGGRDQPPPRSAEGETFELKPLEVSVNLMTLETETPTILGEECPQCGAEVDVWRPGPDMNTLVERLQKAGIDTGRPFEFCIDEVGGQATARQDPWRGE